MLWRGWSFNQIGFLYISSFLINKVFIRLHIFVFLNIQ
jgi:hypothetical protein